MLSAAVLFCFSFLLCSCGTASEIEIETEPSSEIVHMSPEEIGYGYYIYEGVFFSDDEIAKLFKTVSEEYPSYSVVPDHYHVTTEYLPENMHENLYGTKVTVHITGYKNGTSIDPDDGSTSENEGFLVEVSSEDPEMQELLDSIHKTWHITGSYTTAARYTKYMDFSDAEPIDVTIIGTFGKGDSDGKLTLE